MLTLSRRDSKPTTRRQRAAQERDFAPAALARAVVRGDCAAEERALDGLQTLEPSEPRWPHKLGDLLRRRGRANDAAQAYLRAGRLYADLGFAQRAQAMSSLARSLGQGEAPPRVPHASLRP
jgi:hypothetical protein